MPVTARTSSSRTRADTPNGMSFEQMTAYIREHGIACPECGSKNFTDIRKFNLMFKTFMGVTEDAKNEVYLRPETAQGIFVNYANIQRTTRRKLPFGVCQIGKSFRNEITPGNFIFRTREFEQMELEFFCKPDTDLDWFHYWKDYCKNFLLSLGMKEENMRLRDHEKEELSFYSKATTDIEYLFPFGWGELWGIADRTNYDLGRHQEAIGKSRLNTLTRRPTNAISPMLWSRPWARTVWRWRSFARPTTRKWWTREKRHPRGDAPASGAGALQGVRAAAFEKAGRQGRGSARRAGRSISWWIMTRPAPSESVTAARMRSARRCASPIDFETVGDDKTAADGCVTVRDRDTMQQERVKIEDLRAYIEKKIEF